MYYSIHFPTKHLPNNPTTKKTARILTKLVKLSDHKLATCPFNCRKSLLLSEMEAHVISKHKNFLTGITELRLVEEELPEHSEFKVLEPTPNIYTVNIGSNDISTVEYGKQIAIDTAEKTLIKNNKFILFNNEYYILPCKFYNNPYSAFYQLNDKEILAVNHLYASILSIDSKSSTINEKPLVLHLSTDTALMHYNQNPSDQNSQGGYLTKNYFNENAEKLIFVLRNTGCTYKKDLFIYNPEQASLQQTKTSFENYFAPPKPEEVNLPHTKTSLEKFFKTHDLPKKDITRKNIFINDYERIMTIKRTIRNVEIMQNQKLQRQEHAMLKRQGLC